MAMSTFGNTPPAVPAGGKKPAKSKKGVNPFASKGKSAAPPAKGNAMDKKGPIPGKTIDSMKSSLAFK